MKFLELKIPPPLLLVIVGGGMWALAARTPQVECPTWIRVGLAVLMVLVGAAFSITGSRAFRHAKTTINPMKPETASTLVCTGIYRFTRNPMYVGLCFLLAGWAIFLASLWAILGPLALFLYLTRFQVIPEERALAQKFGAEYESYRASVRRWL